MDDENYFFHIDENIESDKVFVLIIYDITDNKKRLKLSKELLERLPAYTSSEDSIRVYKIIGKGQVMSFGKRTEEENEDIIVI